MATPMLPVGSVSVTVSVFMPRLSSVTIWVQRPLLATVVAPSKLPFSKIWIGVPASP